MHGLAEVEKATEPAISGNPAQWLHAVAEVADRSASVALFGYAAPRVRANLLFLCLRAPPAEGLMQETCYWSGAKLPWMDLLCIAPGASLRHSHTGTEPTCVPLGGFQESFGEYHAGGHHRGR